MRVMRVYHKVCHFERTCPHCGEMVERDVKLHYSKSLASTEYRQFFWWCEVCKSFEEVVLYSIDDDLTVTVYQAVPSDGAVEVSW